MQVEAEESLGPPGEVEPEDLGFEPFEQDWGEDDEEGDKEEDE